MENWFIHSILSALFLILSVGCASKSEWMESAPSSASILESVAQSDDFGNGLSTDVLEAGVDISQKTLSAFSVYHVVAVRTPSDVAVIAQPMPLSVNDSGSPLMISDAGLTWVDGQAHVSWNSTVLRAMPLGQTDPMFADAYYPQQQARRALRYRAAGKTVGIVYWIDSRVGLISSVGGSPVYVLERALSYEDGMALEATLKDMKFDPGPVDGVVDAETRRAVGFYLEYRGLEYRFADSVISDGLFKEVVGHVPE